MLSQLFGISEPVLFGIQLRYNLRPLLIMLFTSGLGAAMLSLLNIRSNSYGLAVLPSYLMYIYEGRQLLWYLLISIGSVALCFVLTCMFGIPEEVTVPDQEEAEGHIEKNAEATEIQDAAPLRQIAAPVSGKIIPIEDVNDPTFAEKILGDGFAVEPADELIKSPVAGEVELMYDTGHAVGLRAADGTEILIHIGIDTVELNGKGFTPVAKTGQKVEKGDGLVRVDFDELKRAGKDITVVVIFTSGEHVAELQRGMEAEACQEPVCKIELFRISG